MTQYTDSLTLGQMKYFDLFDNIPYKDIKNIIHLDDDDNEFQVEMEDMPCDRTCWNKIKFTFDLRINISEGIAPIYVIKTYKVELEYNTSSAFALALLDLEIDCESESESESESEEEPQQ